jgi:hypothetical protein
LVPAAGAAGGAAAGLRGGVMPAGAGGSRERAERWSRCGTGRRSASASGGRGWRRRNAQWAPIPGRRRRVVTRWVNLLTSGNYGLNSTESGTTRSSCHAPGGSGKRGKSRGRSGEARDTVRASEDAVTRRVDSLCREDNERFLLFVGTRCHAPGWRPARPRGGCSGVS